VAKYVKSNAIVFCTGGRTLGIGAGQMSRVDAARVATLKAQDLKGLLSRRMRSFLFATAWTSSPSRS